MKILVNRIPDEGLEIDFTEKERWVREKLNQGLGKLYHSKDALQGHLSISRTLNNILVVGNLHLPIHATCDRCLKNYSYEIDVHCERLLSPVFESERQREIEKKLEVEVTRDDLEFSYYEGDEVDMGDIVVEQVLLEQPMIYLCQPHCKGLCPHCGINLNEKNCSCTEKNLKESPFSVLKKWGKK